jgi:DNA-binding MarR family transcriptional regulator
MKGRDVAPGAIFSELVLEVFRLNGRLLAAGDTITRDLGVTSARWQVLGALDIANRPLTVPQIARSMGVTRQGVQRIADLLADQGLVEMVDNPDHQRAKLLRLTSRGRAILDRIMQRQRTWAARIARAADAAELRTTLSVLRTLRGRLEEDSDDALAVAVEEGESHAKAR